MKPEFYVFKLGRSPDPNKPIIGNMPPAAPQAPRRNADRGLRFQDEINAVGEGQPARIGGDNFVMDPMVVGYGQEISRSELREAVICFTTQDAAESYATYLAQKNPTVPYCVVGVLSVFESMPVAPISKKFNERGELVLSEGEVK